MTARNIWHRTLEWISRANPEIVYNALTLLGIALLALAAFWVFLHVSSQWGF